MTIGNALLDVIVDTHGIQRPASWRIGIERGWKPSCLSVRRNKVGDSTKILIGPPFRIVLAKEVIDVVRSRWLRAQQVVQAQVETLGQFPDGFVASVDELTAPFGDLVRVPVAVVRKHSAADAPRRFVDRAL